MSKNPVNEFGQEMRPPTPEEKARGIHYPSLGATPEAKAAMKRSSERPPQTYEQALRQTRLAHGEA